MVMVCTLLNLWEIKEFISEWDGEQLLQVRNVLLDPRSFILSNRDKTIYYILIAKSDIVAVQHIYVAKGSRGKQMFKWIKEVQKWGKDNTKFRFVFNYTTDYRVKMIMKYFGSKHIGVYKGHDVYRTEVR